MTVFVDLLLLLLVIVQFVVRLDIELIAFLADYVVWAKIGVVLLFLLKYGVYIFQALQNIRFGRMQEAQPETPSRQQYWIMGVYPVCDLLRFFIVVGIVSTMINGVYVQAPVFNLYVDSLVYLVIIVTAFFMDYFCKEAETMWPSIICTVVLAGLILFFSKDVFLTGVGMIFQ